MISYGMEWAAPHFTCFAITFAYGLICSTLTQNVGPQSKDQSTKVINLYGSIDLCLPFKWTLRSLEDSPTAEHSSHIESLQVHADGHHAGSSRVFQRFRSFSLRVQRSLSQGWRPRKEFGHHQQLSGSFARSPVAHLLALAVHLRPV